MMSFCQYTLGKLVKPYLDIMLCKLFRQLSAPLRKRIDSVVDCNLALLAIEEVIEVKSALLQDGLAELNGLGGGCRTNGICLAN
jgi:hypothetical protein